MHLKLDPRYWVFSVIVGLLLAVAGQNIRQSAPGGDAIASFIVGVGLALELLGVVEILRARRA